MKKFVYAFEEGCKELKSLLGGKGANLAEMKKIDLPVPEGFTITTEACNQYYVDGKKISDEIITQIEANLVLLEEKTQKKLGDANDPLLVSVRSGAVISMPGMMDTVLNLGLNDLSVEGLTKLTENRRFAMDCYRRFIQMFGDVVLEIPKYKFDKVLDGKKEICGYESDTQLTAADLEEIIEGYKKIVSSEKGFDFPQEPKEQLMMAIEAVFGSWNNERAIVYRNYNEIPHNLGTAVNIQSMVFGNMGMTSGTGVAFTRNPSTGENKLFGEFLINAQGEDVVAGIRTPQKIDELKDALPEVYQQFVDVSAKLEAHYRDMQDIEFTVERGSLYMLQTRTGKRTAYAAVKVAVDMVDEGVIDKKEALMRIAPSQLDQLLHPTFEPAALESAHLLAKGLPASPGAASGKVYFHSADVVKAREQKVKSILVRTETSPEDIEGMVKAEGILTSRGGMTSHAAVVARGMGKCCVAGCGEVKVDEENRIFRIGDQIFKEGDYISLDGNTGKVYSGEIKTVEVGLTGDFAKVLAWADEFRTLGIRTNADNPLDSETAVKFGAEGIGLCRTEHMFFSDDRILNVREMIVASNKVDRVKALDKLLPYQKEDFIGIFKAMGSRPVNIRLLDPPLHEFLPHKDEEISALATDLGVDFEVLKSKVESLSEFNPMLGHRGCRLAITYPEIYEMQVRAIIEAAVYCKEELKIEVHPEIMIPLVGHLKEFTILKKLVIDTATETLKTLNAEVVYKVGTMIEVPRAALIADEIAKEAEFFSFGTNDLTQMTLGFSRDDSGKFLDEYVKKEVFDKDPFESIDQNGVGKLVNMACELGRQSNPTIKLGICGEHGGEPKSIEFCHKTGLNYVSCSPFRVPIARLSAAQAAIKNKDQ
ncbi:pyruvate, phosphate dikinase [Fusibacter ferrireducens]|uniref:Pyruvate, phosphate dikinase n=1 Tax=Fusibacter ferrireducens TaxID=2785058 RepID=A0ABR9ZWU5_9FIRM|nr:pyruvate, phosphate dikinase [Fusibacter ferrireducens]MBF4694930.1 pyruvate, phosphate dikinase [Fusibacter ferrireducens]